MCGKFLAVPLATDGEGILEARVMTVAIFVFYNLLLKNIKILFLFLNYFTT